MSGESWCVVSLTTLRRMAWHDMTWRNIKMTLLTEKLRCGWPWRSPPCGRWLRRDAVACDQVDRYSQHWSLVRPRASSVSTRLRSPPPQVVLPLWLDTALKQPSAQNMPWIFQHSQFSQGGISSRSSWLTVPFPNSPWKYSPVVIAYYQSTQLLCIPRVHVLINILELRYTYMRWTKSNCAVVSK